MAKQTIDALVEGGKASAGPPLGPALGPMGVNIGDVISEINNKTEMFKGMEVPVKVIIDESTKKFNVEVGTPPVSSLIKKEMNVKKLKTISEDKTPNLPGDIPFETIVNIAKAKGDSIAGDIKSKTKQVLGTCVSGGVTVDGKNPRDVQKEIDQGKYDDKF